MSIPKACGVLAMTALLGFTLLSGGVAEGAADQVPREWKEMSFEDIDVSPFYWHKSRGAICRVRSPYMFQGDFCELSITKDPVGLWPKLNIWVQWLEREPAKNCQALVARLCRRDRFVMVFAEPIASTGPWRSVISQQRSAERDRDFPPQSMNRIFRDIRERIELYAIPCSCGGVPIKPDTAVAKQAPPAGGDDSRAPPMESVPPPPGHGVKVPELLGQDPHDATTGGRPGGGPRAMRRPGGFPPDVQVTALRFYPSPNARVPREARAYSARFDDRVEYVNLELNLAYPARTERFPFEMAVTVRKDSGEFTTFTQGDMSLEPGWTDSSHSAGWGKDGGGAWPPGRYRVEVSVNGAVVATEAFEIVGAGR